MDSISRRVAEFAAAESGRGGETVNEILKAGLDLEEKALVGLRETIAYSENVRDFVSPDLADRILRSEEERVDFLDRQSTSSNW